jgi:regulator of PEP synthase PpsR (kinase-PPPase family)
MPLPPALERARKPLIVGLLASPERIVQIRQNRLLSLKADDSSSYVDREAVANEVAASRKLFAKHRWPVIDVTRRSIEETAAAIVELHREHRLKFIAV